MQAADFALRLAFFAIAPYSLVWIAQLFPIVGALVQITLALAVFYLAERGRDPIWAAMEESGALTTDPSVLRPRLQRAMGLEKRRPEAPSVPPAAP
ncbi:MAG: hypothetical protein ABW352_07345 [Polyangiales bacterium]